MAPSYARRRAAPMETGTCLDGRALALDGVGMATIVVAGATGDLGGRITSILRQRGAAVRALVRAETTEQKRASLVQRGVVVIETDLTDAAAVAKACAGAECVVSALQGLEDVIVGVQSTLAESAVAAGVARFVPSDYCSDFTTLVPGENRAFDLRRTLSTALEGAPIAVTSIFNGCFGEVLFRGMPMLDLEAQTCGYWGEDADWSVDFTTMDDTAAFTAAVALDPKAPRHLRVAGDRVSARGMAAAATELLGRPFQLVRLGSLEELRFHNQRERAAHPEHESEVSPSWQRGQYLLAMFSSQLAPLDNARYPQLSFTTIRELLAARLVS